MTAEEQFEHFIEQAGRRYLQQQFRQTRDRLGGGPIRLEPQLGGKAGGAQHAHRVFPVALLRVADQAQHAALDVAPALHEVVQGEVGDVVVKGVDGEIPAQGVFLDAAPGVVAQYQSGFLMGQVLVVVQVVPLEGPEGGDLDDLAAEAYVHDLEAAADDAAALEQTVHLLRRGVGDHVEVLGLAPAQQVTQAAADQIGLETGLVQAVEHIQGGAGNVLAGDRVLVAGDHPCFGKPGHLKGTFAQESGPEGDEGS